MNDRPLGGDRPDHPLAGRNVLVTRPTHQATSLVRALAAYGANVTAIPLIRIAGLGEQDGPAQAPVYEWLQQAQALDPAADPGWLAITSANGAHQVVRAATTWGGADGTRLLRRFRLAAVGPATAAKLRQDGFVAGLVPSEHTGEALATALADTLEQGQRVTLARGDLASPLLPERLRAAGATVTELVVYRTLPDRAGLEAVRRELASGHLDVVVFTSPSAVHACLDACGGEARNLLGPVRRAAIGPVTAAALSEAGLPPHVVPVSATAAALAAALAGEA
jgi:uroporphyrinogen-III synthase